jgi:hypothetical protein
MAKYRGFTILIQIKIAACLYSPTTQTIVLLNENKVQIRSFDTTFPTTCTLIGNNWKEQKHKLTPTQRNNIQKLLHKLYTLNIYSLNNFTMPNGTTLMNPLDFKKQYNSCSKCIKIEIQYCQTMFCQNDNPNISHPLPNYNLLPQYHIQNPIIQNPNQNQLNRDKSSHIPKNIYTKLYKYPIQQIFDIKSTNRKDKYQIQKNENRYLCKWALPDNIIYTRWILKNKIFPYNKINIS